MRSGLIALAIGCFFLPTAAGADDKDAAVKEIDLKGLKLAPPRGGKIDMPTAIKNAEELAKAVPDAEAQEKIKKEVDFAKQQLLFFAWSGSGGDKIAPAVDKSAKGSEVVFQYQRGLTRDLRPHLRLFAVPKDGTWKVAQAK